VKPRRRYDSSGRQAQARRNREAILDAAQRQFLDGGYAATTIAAVAAEAGVSVETIYKAFGGKPGLVRAIYDRGLVGREPVPAYQRADQMRERETDPRTIMRNWAAIATEVSTVVSPIERLVRAAAATDPDMAALLQAHHDTRERRARHHARFLKRRGYLREGVSLAQATDILWTCTSDELYDLLVTQRGWAPPRYARWLADYMIAALLPPAHSATPGP
ncbi:MAG TPA: TetR/AcrR family transcriptional regulator, partial [Actinomycetota bacterium]|nr:TetR/AcrR family transcriptional regulator [Actinomycetota bacterium]